MLKSTISYMDFILYFNNYGLLLPPKSKVSFPVYSCRRIFSTRSGFAFAARFPFPYCKAHKASSVLSVFSVFSVFSCSNFSTSSFRWSPPKSNVSSGGVQAELAKLRITLLKCFLMGLMLLILSMFLES